MRYSSTIHIYTRLTVLVFALALSGLVMPPLNTARAASPHFMQVVAPATAPNYTIIVLDMSGSMRDNDASGIRCSAASAYINLSGPGDFVGVIGLDNNNGATDAEGFQTAQLWSQPVELSTTKARQDLIATINAKSRNCAPDNETPTYDALKQALAMLQSAATTKGHIMGSVILLTDGAPEPDPSGQENAVNTKLRPEFQQNGWPVNTIALGADTDFHTFLSDLATPTSGHAYDDAKGTVSGVSALNISPFFVDIFTRSHPHFAQHESNLIPLNGGVTSRDLNVGEFVDHMYVIVTKDQADTEITLATPSGHEVSQASPGVAVASDRNYTIYSIDGPPSGTWTVSGNGAGMMLVQDVIDSSLSVAISEPDAKQRVLPLGQTFSIAATIENHGAPITGAAFTLTGTITAAGSTSTPAYSQKIVLSDKDSPGTYRAKVNVPSSAGAGAYDITVSATQVSDSAISSASVTVRLELFPQPFLLKHGHPVLRADAQVVQWDPILSHLYAIPFAPVQWLGGIALDGFPAIPSANVPGQVMLNGQLYRQATVKGTAARNGSTQTVQVLVSDDGNGHFHVLFPSDSNGEYVVSFETRGIFRDSHGDFGPSTATVNVSVVKATPPQEIRAIIWTLVFILVLLLLILIVRFFMLPPPVAVYRISSAEFSDPKRLSMRRSLSHMLLARNVLRSRDTFNKPGLLLRIDRQHRVAARRQQGSAGLKWSRTDGGALSTHRYQRVTSVRYGQASTPASGDDRDFNAETYSFPDATHEPRRTRHSPDAIRGNRPGAGGRRGRRPSIWQRLFRSRRTRTAQRRPTRSSNRGI